jgi:hypothetical protein
MDCHLVSRGTFVRKARLSSDKDDSWPLCIKCSWRSQDRVDEKGALLALQHIPCIVKMVAGQDGVDITQCRRNMLSDGPSFPSGNYQRGLSVGQLEGLRDGLARRWQGARPAESAMGVEMGRVRRGNWDGGVQAIESSGGQ